MKKKLLVLATIFSALAVMVVGFEYLLRFLSVHFDSCGYDDEDDDWCEVTAI